MLKQGYASAGKAGWKQYKNIGEAAGYKDLCPVGQQLCNVAVYCSIVHVHLWFPGYRQTWKE